MGLPLLSRVRAFGQIFGSLFGGKRDLYKVFGYKNPITYDDMLFKYMRQDIAPRIVEAEPRETWSRPPQIDGPQNFVDAWQSVVDEHDVFDALNRLDILVGMSRFALLLIGVDDGRPLEQPVSRRYVNSSPRNLLYLQPYSERAVRIMEFDEDPTSPRFNLPLIYEITPNPALQNDPVITSKFRSVDSIKVHHSRILHVAENPLEDRIYGFPRLERVYNLLDDMQKTVGGSAETYWLTSNRGMQADVDKEMDLNAADAEQLSEEIEEYQNNLSRFIRTRGVTLNNLGSDVADPSSTFKVQIALLSGATGIPQRILLGSEAGQLASEQDRANWASRIEDRRNLFAEPTILKPFIRHLMEMGVLPTIDMPKFVWPEAFRQNPLERAQTSAQQARTLANVTKALSDDQPVVTLEEARKIIGLGGTVPVFDDQNNTPNEPDESDDSNEVGEDTDPPITNPDEED